MVIGLGVDLVELTRVKQMLARWGPRLLAKLLSSHELDGLPSESENRILALAHAITAKEAASKAIGTGWSRGISWRHVEVSLDGPRLRLRGPAAAVAKRLGSNGDTRLRFETRDDLLLAEVWLLG